MRRPTWHRTLTALAATTMLATACTHVVEGTAQRDSTGVPPGAIDPALLDPGNNPTTPQPPLGTATTPAAGALLDAQRMAEFVTGPWEADPSLIVAAPFGFGPGAMPIKGVIALEPVTGIKGLSQAAAPHNYVNGYATARDTADHHAHLFNVVLRFASPADAAGAATDMSHTAATNPGDTAGTPSPVTPEPIPGHPDTLATSRTVTSTTGRPPRILLHAFTAHGPYVLFQFAEVTPPMTDAAALVAKTLDLQGPAIDGFQITDPTQLTELPRDPSGLLARTLPAHADQANVNNNATFGPHAALHYQSNPIASAKLFADTGVDVVVRGLTTITRARDAAGATTVAAAATTEAQAAADPAAPVPHMPDSRCFTLRDTKYHWCVATAGRYEIELSAAQLHDAHQMMAAQYLMVTAK